MAGMVPVHDRRSITNMKIALTTFIIAGLATSVLAADEGPLKTTKDKVSYTLGMNLGKQLKQSDVEIDLSLYAQGVKDALAGKPLLTEDQARDIMKAFSEEMQTKKLEKQKTEGEANKKAGEAFLAENKKKEGITTTASGLQYKIETKGTGKLPASTDTVSCHYRGTLIDGTEFDSSYKRGEPAKFPVTGVIKGWIEALQMMPVGSKWKLFIPGDLAYGDKGRPSIPPNSTLLFDIELIGIEDPAAAGAPPAAPTAQPKIQIQPK